MRLTDVAAEAELEAEDGALTLVNLLAPDRDPKLLEGVLLVQHSGEWRPVCDDGFGAAEAYVACGQLLGFPEWYGPGNAGEKTLNEFWFTELPPPWLDQVACTGNETRLVDCAHAAWGVTDCEAIEAVALSCPKGPKPPPAPPGNSLENSVVDAGAGAASSHGVHVGTEPAVLSLNASGIADGELRLVGGSTPSEGRLEVAYRQQWGTVCGFMFGPEDARVACRALGLPHEGAQVLDARVFSQLGTPGDLGNPAQAPPIWLGNLGCSGTETSLAQCPSNGWGVSGCTHLQNVGLRCAAAASSGGGTATSDSQGPTRLRLDSPPSGGRVAGVVELLHEGTWGRICLTPATTAATYAVLCRELGYAAEGAAPEPGLSRDLKHRTSYRPFWLADVACGGGEASVRHCRSLGWGAHSCDPLGFHEQPLALSCALPAGADGSGSPASTPALATPPVIPPPARTGANETAVCAVTLIGRGSAEELSQASVFGEDSQLLSASLHCRTASGAPLPVAAGKRLADLLNITAGSHSGVILTQRMHAGNDTALDEEWGLTFSGLEALALVDSVVRDIRLSRAGPLLHFVDCATLALTNVTLTRLYGAKVYKPIPVPTFDENGIPTGVSFYCRPYHRVYGALHASGLTGVGMTDVSCQDVRDSHGWSCFLLHFRSAVPANATSGPDLQLNVTDCRITGNTVAYGGFHGTSWYDNSVSSLRFADDDKACVREHVGYGAVVITADDAPAVALNITVEGSALDFNAGQRGAAITVLSGQLRTGKDVYGLGLYLVSRSSLVGNAARAHKALWWPEWPCDASFSGGALYLASTQREATSMVTLVKHTRALRNSAARDGGFMYSALSTLVYLADHSQMAHNEATCNGGGAIKSDCYQSPTFAVVPDVRLILESGAAVINNSAGGSGGALDVAWTGVAVIVVRLQSMLSGNTARGLGGGGAVKVWAAFYMLVQATHDSQVSYNTAELGDGGAFMATGVSLNTEDTDAFYRSQLYVEFQNNTEICGNRALGGGGGGAGRFNAFLTNTLVVYRSSVADNYAQADGGAFSVEPRAAGDYRLEVHSSQVSGNACGVEGFLADGGAFAVQNKGTVTVRNSTFSRNRASGEGGALRVLGFCSNLSIASSAFDSNSAGKAGGVLSIQHPGLDLLEVLHTRMANNSATIGGGALALVGTYAGAAVLWNTTIEGSRAGVADGGAVNWQVRIPDAHPLAGGTLRSPLLNLTATTLRNNQASFGQGGGLFVRPRAPTLATNGTGPRPNMTILIRDGSRFEGNTAAGSGAGLNLLASRQELDVFVAVDQSWFVSNRAGDSVSSVTGSGASGGGISMGYTGSVDAGSPSACGLLVSRSTFYGNRCGGGGGGALVLTSCVANVTRSTFSANTASYEGGAISLAEEETLKAPGGAVNSNLTAEFPWGPGEDEGAKRRRLASAALYGAPYVPYGLDGLPYTLHVDSSSFMNCLPANPLPLLVSLTGCELTGNTANGGSGGALFAAAWRQDQPTNTAPSGATLPPLSVQIRHCDVSRNSADQQGGAVKVIRPRTTASLELPPRLLLLNSSLADNRAGADGGTAAGQGTTLLLYGTVLYGNNASTSGGTHVPRGGAVYIDGAVAVALMNCDLTDNNDVNDADWGAALASTQTCLQELNGSNATLAESVPAAASFPWSGAVARSAVSTWALLERARDVGCWMLGLYDTLLPSHALGVLKLYLLDADNSTDTNLDLEQTTSEDATGMPLYLTDTSASSLAVSCRPEDTGAATPSVVPASASGDVSQQLAAAEAGLWLVADSFLVGTGNASAPLLPARGELLLRALDDCRELSYITTFGEAQKDRMTSALQDKSIAYLGLAPNTLRLESIYATDGSVKVVRPFTGQANFSTASKAAVLEPAAKTGQITLQMGATYSIGVEMVDGLGERLTAAEGEYLVRVSIVPELPVWLSTVPSAVAWANSKNASSFASIEAFDLSVPLLRGLAIFDQVSLNGWPGYYFLSIRAESNSGNASGLAIQVPIYITPCNPGERLDLRWSLTSCIVCTDDQYSFWTDSRPDLQELIGEAMAQVGVTSQSFTLAALGRVPGVVTERIQSWVVQEQSASICNNCPEGAYCPGGAAVVPLPGYWHSAANSTQMHLCPQSSACEGFWTDINVTAAGSNASAASTTRTTQAPAVRTSILENDPRVRGLRSCESLWYAQWPPGASVLADPSASQSDMEQGDSPTACLLWGVQAHHPNSYMQQQCADGFGGRACTVCQKGHFTTPEFECESCQSVDWSAALGVLQFMSSAVLGLYTVWTNLRESEGTKYGVVEGVEVERMTAGDVLKAALVHCQIFVTVTRLSMDWPPIIVQFQGVLRSASGGQSAFSYSPSCLFPEADAAEAARIQTLTGLIQPLLVIAMVGLVWAMRWLVFGREAWSTRKASAPVAEEDVPSADNLDEMPSARPSGEGSISERREPPLTTGEGGKAAQQAVAEGVEAAAGNDDPRAAGLAEPPASPDRPLADVSVHPSGVHLLHPPPRLVLETTAVTALPPPEGDEDGAASAAGLVSLGGEATTAGADVVDAVGPNRYSLEAVSPSTPMPLLDAMAAPHAWKPSHAPAARVGSGLLGRKPSLAPSSPARSFSGVGPSRLSQQPSFHGDAAFAPPPGSPRRNGRSSSAAGDRPANLTTALQQPMIAIPGSPARASRDDAAVTAAAGFKVQDFDDVTDHGGGQESPQQEPQEQQQTRLPLLPQSTAAGNRIGGIAGAERSVHSPRASASLFPTRTVSEAGAGRAASPSLRHDSALRHQASTGRQPSVNGGEGSFRSDSAVDGKAAVSRAAPARKDGQGKGEAPEGLDGEDGTENEEGRDGDGEGTEGKGDQKPRKKHMMIDTILSLPRQLCVVVVVFILYSTWSQAALSIFACYRLDDGSGPYPELQQATSDSGYWMTNMDLACYAGEHATLYVPVGIVAVLLVCAGPPIASAILLYLHRDKLHLKKTQLVYGFLYTRYKRRWWWWESVVQLQMLALVVVDVFGRALSLTQQAIVMLLSMSVISAINVACAPLSHPALILLDFASMAVLSSTVLLGLFAADSRKASDDTIIGAVIVSINVMLLAAFVGLIIYCSRSALQSVVTASRRVRQALGSARARVSGHISLRAGLRRRRRSKVAHTPSMGSMAANDA